MYRSYCAAGVIGKMGHLALLGVAILFLGPVALGVACALLGVVIGVVSLALPFVVIGALAYGPYLLVRQTFGSGRQRPVMQARRPVPPMPPRPIPVRLAVAEQPAASPPVVRRFGGVASRVAREVFCGALVGGALGAVAVIGTAGTWHTPALVDYAGLGTAIGAVVGFVVGGPRPTPVEKSAAA